MQFDERMWSSFWNTWLWRSWKILSAHVTCRCYSLCYYRTQFVILHQVFSSSDVYNSICYFFIVSCGFTMWSRNFCYTFKTLHTLIAVQHWFGFIFSIDIIFSLQVKEHKRKMKKEAKKNPTKRAKKDPGIPNLAPFKEAILREAEEKKMKVYFELHHCTHWLVAAFFQKNHITINLPCPGM